MTQKRISFGLLSVLLCLAVGNDTLPSAVAQSQDATLAQIEMALVDTLLPDGAAKPDRAAAALAGSGYTVLGRTFLGESGNISYLRFLNLSGSTASVNATLVGSPSGRNYGTTQVSIPNNASRQVAINQLMTSVGLLGLISPDTRLAVFLQSGSDPVAVQHVLYSAVNGFFENLSSCQNSSMSDSNSALVNVHTTRIPDYTSFINIYNFGDTTATYDIDIYNSETGASIGRVPVTIEPNSAFEQPFSYFQTQMSFTPDASTFHVNMAAFPRSGARTAAITHIVFNERLSAYLNLTNFCTIAPTLSGLPVANSDNIPVPSSKQPFTIPFATLTANDSNATTATLIGVTQPRSNGSANGSLTQSGNNLTYTPSRDGLATFEYRLRNSLGDSGIAIVTLNVGDGNDGGDDNTDYKLTMAKSGAGTGSVTSSPAGINCGSLCSNRTFDFNAGVTVTLTASSASGSTFLGWGGACSGTAITCNMVMNSNQSVTASFGLSTNTLTVSKITVASGTGTGGGSGSVTSSTPGIDCGNTCNFGFNAGSTVTLTASPANGSTFLGWGGACSGTTLTCNVVMSSEKAVTASFGVPNYNLTVSKSGTGTVTSSQQPGISCGSTCTFAFNSGTTVSLTATPPAD